MNKFYNNEDDFLRRKLMEHEFDAQPQAWEQMSTLLDSQPIVAKRYAGYWWSLPIAALMIGVAGSFYYYNKKAPTLKANMPLALQMNAVSKKRATTTLPVITPSTVVAPRVSSVVASNTPTATPINQKETTSTNTTTAIPAPTAPAILNAANKTTKKYHDFNNKSTDNFNNNSTTSVATTVKKAAPNEKIEGIPSRLESMSKIPSKNRQHRLKKRRTEIIYQYSATPLRLLQEKKQQELGTFGIKEEVNFKKSPIKFGIVAGASTQLPVISPQKVALRPVLGVQIASKFAKRHSIQIGTQYKNLVIDTDPSIKNHTYKNEQSQHKHISHHIRNLHLLEFPVVYKMHPHPKCNLQVGVKPAVLVGVDSDAKKSVNLGDANLGLSTWDLGVLLGAEYCLNKHWSIGIQYTLGLINMAQNSKILHEQQQSQNRASNDPIPAQAISKDKELLVPVGTKQNTLHHMRIPEQVKNSDLQLLLKYSF